MRYLLLIFLLVGCNKPQNDFASISIPNVLVEVSDKNIVNKDGIIYYQNQSFSGFLTEKQAGKLIFKEGYLNGKQEGESNRWFLNGQLAEQRFYHENRKEAKHTGWWENGQKRFEYHFKTDIPVGHHQEWYPSGRVFTSFHFDDQGQPEGSQQMWFEDGKVKSNYVMKNGRRYGFYGAKGCMGKNEKKQSGVNIENKSI
ncbi:MAG: toxin-antitoxin system YwqK family antitoxin [Spirosomataceae bacterium]